MRYVGGVPRDSCVFCEKLAQRDDTIAFILHRAESCFAIMNLFPYNTGHIMVVPNTHMAGPEDADTATLEEMSALLPLLLRALRRVLTNDGFNIGINVGSVAGAGIAAHLHQHIVPRWRGDANFMPIIGSTMVLPELIPTTYAKLRAELCAFARPEQEILTVAFDSSCRLVLLCKDDLECALPRSLPSRDEPAWSVARKVKGIQAGDIEFLGWAGPKNASDYSSNALFAKLVDRAPANDGFVPVVEAVDRLTNENHRAALRSALASLDQRLHTPS